MTHAGERDPGAAAPDPEPGRSEGRPTGPADTDGLRAGRDQHEAPTEAPEEQGEEPETEHAPGADL
jgi:hypothetical protein